MKVRPFPWNSLDALTHSDVTRLRQLGHLLGHRALLSDSKRELEVLLRTPFAASLRSIEPVASAPDDGAVAVAIETSSGMVALELEAALAIELVGRAIGRELPPLTFAEQAHPLEAVAGSVAAIVVKAHRRATGEVVRVLGAGAASTVLAALGLPDSVAASYVIVVGDDAYRARVVFSKAMAARAPEPAFTAAALARLGSLALEMPVIATASWATAGELRRLEVGAVWMPGSFTVRPGARVLLGAARVDRAVHATLESEGTLVVGNAVEDLTMSHAAEDTLLESALDAPVVVRVEVGSVVLTAREWAALKPGDVVTLTQRIGSPVILRAGGAELGRGELVDIDGEVGVRLLSIAENPS